MFCNNYQIYGIWQKYFGILDFMQKYFITCTISQFFNNFFVLRVFNDKVSF